MTDLRTLLHLSNGDNFILFPQGGQKANFTTGFSGVFG